MKIGKKGLLSTALICGLLIAPTPSFAYREFVDNGTPCVEATYENGQINYSLAKPITIHVDGKYIPSDVDPTIRKRSEVEEQWYLCEQQEKRLVLK